MVGKKPHLGFASSSLFFNSPTSMLAPSPNVCYASLKEQQDWRELRIWEGDN